MYISKLKIYNQKKCSNAKKFKTCIYKEKLNPFLKQNPNILKNFDEKFVECINKFLNTFQRKNYNINLDLFYKNLVNLSIKEKKTFNRLGNSNPGINGSYSFKNNRIDVLKNNYEVVIYHELLHCASTQDNENGFSSGFYRYFNKTSIGNALNEGYTALLEERYFDNKCSYPNLKPFSKVIELLIGKEKMEKFYFTNDLNGLIKEFEKYGSSKNETIFFLNQLDYIKYNLGFDENVRSCQFTIYNVIDFLIRCYQKKDASKLDEYLDNFKSKIKVNNIVYDFSTNKPDIYSNYEINEYYFKEIENFKNYHRK